MNNAHVSVTTGETWRVLHTWAAHLLENAGIHNSAREAAWLAEHSAGVSSGMLSQLYDKCPDEKTDSLFRHYVHTRAKRYPLQYILGYVPFLNVHIHVTEDVLIPRPETEQLASLVLDKARAYGTESIRCLDLGMGSGCLAVALAKELSESHWDAVDISEKAVETARKNARENNIDSRISFYCGSWWDALPHARSYDIIVTNPPYIPAGTPLEKELQYEPERALFAGEDGCDAYRIIVQRIAHFLKPHGFFMGEYSPEQTQHLQSLIHVADMTASFLKDAAEKERFLCLTHTMKTSVQSC